MSVNYDALERDYEVINFVSNRDNVGDWVIWALLRRQLDSAYMVAWEDGCACCEEVGDNPTFYHFDTLEEARAFYEARRINSDRS